MFDFLLKSDELEEVLFRLKANMSNNYKDAAQDNLKEFESKYEELKNSGKLKGKKQAYYEKILLSLKDEMKEFTHKDQKPYWH